MIAPFSNGDERTIDGRPGDDVARAMSQRSSKRQRVQLPLKPAGGGFHRLQEEVLVEILAHVRQPSTLCHIVALSMRRLSTLCRANRIWCLLCELRWTGRAQAPVWQARATAQQHLGVADAWQQQFRLTEEELVPTYPVFYMSGQLRLGSVIGMHFFEPRYRLLIKKITLQCHDPRFARKFAFFPRCPVGSDKLEGWVCEAQDVHIYADGRADLNLLPVAKINRQSAWADSAGLRPNDPPLFYVRGEIQVPALDSDGESSVESDVDEQLLSDEDFGILIAQPSDESDESDSE